MGRHSVLKKVSLVLLGVSGILALPACGGGGSGGGGGSSVSGSATENKTEITVTVATGAMVADTSLNCRNIFDKPELTEADLQSGKFILDQGFESLQAFDAYDVVCRSSFFIDSVKTTYHVVASSADILKNKNININKVTEAIAQIKAKASGSTAEELFGSGKRNYTSSDLNGKISTAISQLTGNMRTGSSTPNFETANWTDKNNKWQDDFIERMDVSVSNNAFVLKDRKGNQLVQANVSDFMKGQLPSDAIPTVTMVKQATEARGQLPDAIPTVTAKKDSSGRVTCDKRSVSPSTMVTCTLPFDQDLKDIVWYVKKRSDSGSFYTGDSAQETIIGGQGFSANYTFNDYGVYYVYVKVKGALYGTNAVIMVPECTVGAVESRSCSIANANAVEKRLCTLDRGWTPWGEIQGVSGVTTVCSVQSCNSGFTQSGNQCVQGSSTGGPTASFVVTPTSGDPTTIFTFDASGSKAVSGSSATLKALWDLDNNGTWDTHPSLTAQDYFFYKFEQVGTYNIKLQVVDDSGLTSTVTQTINVTAQQSYDPALSSMAGDSSTLSSNNSAPSSSFKTMTWRITDRCDDGKNVDFRFYDSQRRLVYPEKNRMLVTSGFNKTARTLVLCLPGETICFGGNTSGGSSYYWGVGLDGTKNSSVSASNGYCNTCAESTFNFNPGCSSTSSSSGSSSSTPTTVSTSSNRGCYMTTTSGSSCSSSDKINSKNLGIYGSADCSGNSYGLYMCYFEVNSSSSCSKDYGQDSAQAAKARYEVFVNKEGGLGRNAYQDDCIFNWTK